MMKLRLLSLLLCALLAGCAGNKEPVSTAGEVTAITLSDGGVTVDGQATAVEVGGEIIYYHDGTDESYGEGEESEKYDPDEAAGHTLVTITQSGTYRLRRTISKGQIAVDLGEGAKDDPNAVVTLILDNANVTCTVAPALIFYNVYECDREFVAYDKGENPDYQASATVDTARAGANVVIAAGTENTFTGSHVARIYQEGTTKKLHKYDGAVFSKMSINVAGDNGDDSGVWNIIGDKEGLETALHLTLNGGTLDIQSRDDGVNSNEDNVSVTTVNGGILTVNAGNGEEGDGIDSNGYLVINGGSVTAMSNDRSPDGGVDADRDILLNGGTLAAFGTRNESASRDSAQQFLEFNLSTPLSVGSTVELKDGQGNVLWSATAQGAHRCLTLSLPELTADGDYQLYVDGQLQENASQGFGFGHGGPGGHPGDGQTPPELPEDFDPSQFKEERPERPSDLPERGEDFNPGEFKGERPQRPDGQRFPGGELPAETAAAATPEA